MTNNSHDTHADMVERLRLFARPEISDITTGEYKDACKQGADALERLFQPQPTEVVEAATLDRVREFYPNLVGEKAADFVRNMASIWKCPQSFAAHHIITDKELETALAALPAIQQPIDVGKLREALRPFAEIRVHKSELGSADAMIGVKIADIRRAAAVYETLATTGDDPGRVR